MTTLTVTEQPTLRLADHVKACVLDDQVILLDLRRSKYLSVNRARWADLTGEMSDRGTPAAAEPLLRQGMLTLQPAGHARSPEHLPEPTSSLDAGAALPLSAIDAGCALRLLAAALWSTAALRLRSLQYVATRVAARSAHTTTPVQDAHLHAAVAAFDAVRPLIFTSRERCLNDSLTLVTFLASEGIAARWVVGVRSQPFRAHAWVQAGAVVLNDLHENVRRFQPILVV